MRTGKPLSDEHQLALARRDRRGDAGADRNPRRGGGGLLGAEAALVATGPARRRGAPAAFVMLRADKDELACRVASRPDHYMPVSLLESQLAALEVPDADEPALILDAHRAPDDLCRSASDWLSL